MGFLSLAAPGAIVVLFVGSGLSVLGGLHP